MPAPKYMHGQQGATRLEWVVVSIILSVLTAWLLHTLRFYEELTEKTVVESSVMNMRTGLRFRIADLVIKGALDKQLGLIAQNPVAFLEKPPKGYLGELRTPGNLPAGAWYFEQEKHELVYIPLLTSNLQLNDAQDGARGVLRWQIRAVGEGNGLQSVDVELLTPYRWF